MLGRSLFDYNFEMTKCITVDNTKVMLAKNDQVILTVQYVETLCLCKDMLMFKDMLMWKNHSGLNFRKLAKTNYDINQIFVGSNRYIHFLSYLAPEEEH